MEVTREQFLAQRNRTFGHQNPTRMNVPFWEFMVRNGQCAYWATAHFGAADEVRPGPVWCFDRFGMSQTALPDGRTICIAGEHEDHYDPDFCIYNDVIVRHDDGRIEIFGYPADVFPPTDFHSATLINGDQILLIGSLGYPADRRPDQTQLLLLDLNDYRMSTLETSGELPGWISRHEAQFDNDRTITIRGGKTIRMQDGEQILRDNVEEFALDLTTRSWKRNTDRRWKQFAIRPESLARARSLLMAGVNSFRPAGLPHSATPGAEWNELLLCVDGVMITLSLRVSFVHVLIQGNLPDRPLTRLLQEIQTRVEQVSQSTCVTTSL